MASAEEKTEIRAIDLKKRLDSGENVLLLDVREEHELLICKIPNSLHIPMGNLPDKLKDLEPYKDKELVIYCHSGRRSDRCAEFLRDEGFKKVLNLSGGIDAWTDQVDPTMKRY